MNMQGLQTRLIAAHDNARAAFEKTAELVRRADQVRKGLAKLTKMGDQVTHEDVVGEAGKLVAKGEDPLVLAGLLADMPADGGGEALAGWVAAHAQQAGQTEQQILQAHEAAKHQMGVAAIHVLQAASGPGEKAQASSGLQSQAPMNPATALTPTQGPGPTGSPENPLMGAPN